MTQSEYKYLLSLKHQKYRKEYNAYIIEGDKLIKEWIMHKADIQYVVATEDWVNAHFETIDVLPSDILRIVPYFKLQKLTQLKNVPQVLASVLINKNKSSIGQSDWSLVLDGIRDPGNVGTIIRIADWFGIKDVISLSGTVESYNPKLIQASMGSILRVNMHHFTVLEFKEQMPAKDLYAAVLNGMNYNEMALNEKSNGYLVLGNESKGINNELLSMCNHKITIPKVGHAESLNVAVACGILCAAIKS